MAPCSDAGVDGVEVWLALHSKGVIGAFNGIVRPLRRAGRDEEVCEP